MFDLIILIQTSRCDSLESENIETISLDWDRIYLIDANVYEMTMYVRGQWVICLSELHCHQIMLVLGWDAAPVLCYPGF